MLILLRGSKPHTNCLHPGSILCFILQRLFFLVSFQADLALLKYLSIAFKLQSTMSGTETLSWTKPSVSKEAGNWADLVTLDLSKFDQPGGKQDLAAEFTRAIEEVGMITPSGALTPSSTTPLQTRY